MPVFVDDMYKTKIGRLGRMKMSHMVADTHEELVAMADTIGVARRWLQKAGTPEEHFDISLGARRKAVAAGACEITWRDLPAWLRARGRHRI